MAATGKYDDSWLYLNTDEIDLSEYREAIHKHDIVNPLAYREELVDHFTGDPHTKGEKLPWESMDGFRVREGEVTIFAGQSFAGKSAILTQCMTHWVRGKEKVLLISPEFSPSLNLSRVVQQIIGKVPAQINEADVTAVLAFLEGRMLIYDAVGQVDIDDLMSVIADRYLKRPPCPIKDMPNRTRIPHIQGLAREWDVAGAIIIQQKFCDPHELDKVAIKKGLEDAGFPTLYLEFDVTVPIGPFRIRVEAFLETLSEEDLF